MLAYRISIQSKIVPDCVLIAFIFLAQLGLVGTFSVSTDISHWSCKPLGDSSHAALLLEVEQCARC